MASVQRFVACGRAMSLGSATSGSDGAGTCVSKCAGTPEFAVALTSPLSPSETPSIDVVFTGDQKYFAVGVASAGIPLDASPRRLDAGIAWFLLNKGFLCDGCSL